MSVFLKNTCQFNNCRKNYHSLSDLIVHIENDHLDFNLNKIEQLEEEKPECLPLSYVLKFSGPEDSTLIQECKNEIYYTNEPVIQDLDDVAATEMVTASSNNYIDCDFKDKKVKNDVRLSTEEICEILGSNKLFTFDHNHKKPFACNMKGCEKRYKNVNGIKYHYKNYHKMLIPTFKKSLLKHKPAIPNPKPKLPRHNLHGIPLYNFNPPPPPAEFLYQNLPQTPRFYEDAETIPNEFFYKFNSMTPAEVQLNTSQVPLQNNMSFNYYNVSDVNGDIDDFSGKNSTYFVSNFDRY